MARLPITKLALVLALSLAAHGQILSGIVGAGSGVAPAASCHTVATDNWASPPDSDGNWTKYTGTFGNNSNTVYGQNATDSSAAYTASSFNADQAGQAVYNFTGSPSNSQIAIALRMTDGNNYYVARAINQSGVITFSIAKDSTFTELKNCTTDLAGAATGDTFLFSVAGTTLTFKDVTASKTCTVTDASHASGKVGVWSYSNSTLNNLAPLTLCNWN